MFNIIYIYYRIAFIKNKRYFEKLRYFSYKIKKNYKILVSFFSNLEKY